jgi:predicted transposase YbfD/YdcC
VVTGDALYCQRALCAQIVAQGGDYLIVVKGNQPALQEAITLLFDQPPPGEVLPHAVRRDRHGDRWERRTLRSSSALRGYLDWPGLGQVAQLERWWTQRGQQHREVRHLITSLDSTHGPQELLALARGHWAIENRLHHVRDVTLGEDASRIRSDGAPQVMAALRNVVLTVLRAEGVTNVAAALRDIAWRGTALSHLGLAP